MKLLHPKRLILGRRLAAHPITGCLLMLATIVTIGAVQPRESVAAINPRAMLVIRETPGQSEQKKKIEAQKPVENGAAIFRAEQAMSNHDLLYRWEPLIQAAAKKFAVPADWIRAVMIQESGGRTMLSETRRWISNKGAMGLMQIMPETWADLRSAYGFGDDPFNAEDNINAGAAYLRWMRDKYGFSGMFAAYNAGPARLEYSMTKSVALPQETIDYVAGVARSLGIHADATMPPSLRSAPPEIAAVEVAASVPVVVDAAAINVADIKVEPEFEVYDRKDLYAPCAFASGMGCGSAYGR